MALDTTPLGTSAIRWDLAGLAEIAAASDAKADRLLHLRRLALTVAERSGRTLDLRQAVIAAHWGYQSATMIRSRRRLLAIAEDGLAADLEAIGPIEPASWRPELRSRPIDSIERDLEAALDAGREAAAAGLTLEMARGQRDLELMAAEPHLPTIAQLQSLIDFLAYEWTRAAARPTSDWRSVERAVAQIKDRLDESWMRDVRRSDLLAINRIIGELSGADLDAVILQLEDTQLYRWLREMDGVGGGNLTADEERTLFRTIAENASAATIFRIAQSERGGKFAEITLAVSEAAPAAVAIEFVEICAANASHSELALSAALGVLVALTPDARLVAYTALLRSGAAEQLAQAAKAYVAAHLIERDGPLVQEFLEGAAAGLTGAGAAMWDLTGSLFVDSHSFREAWAGLGRTVSLAWHDPIEFVAVVMDVDTLARNPAKWAGVAATDVATFGAGRAARLGRLGSAAKTVADWIRRFGSRTAGVGDIELRAGHLTSTLDRLDRAANAVAIRALIDRQQQVDDLNGVLNELPGALPGMELTGALQLIRSIGTATESLVAEIAEALAA